ncbi:MAG TPA: protein-disulfide reductase DsbD domain-containing protein [Terriglobales bacterium]
MPHSFAFFANELNAAHTSTLRSCNPADAKVVKFHMPVSPRMKLAVLGVLLLFSTNHLSAQVNEFHVKIELISESAAAEAREPFWVGLLFHLDEGWHIYWQNPGDAGEPPKVQWALSPGFTPGLMLWPQPIRLGTGSVIDYGYENQVLLMTPLLMTPIERSASSAANSTPVIAADVKYIVCREVCIPGRAHLTLSSPSSARQLNQWHQLFEQTRTQIPGPAPKAWKLSARTGADNNNNNKDHFILSVRTESKVHAATFFPAEPGQIENSAPQGFAVTADGFRLSLKKSDLLVKPITSLKGLLVLGPGRAFDIAAPVAAR